MYPTSPTLLTVVTAGGDSRAVRIGERVGAAAFITALTAIAAQVSLPLPFTPVPFTFQPMIVLLGGAVLGSRLGMTSQVLYLALGIAGLPVFAASSVLPPGAARLLGPTGGYLLSYPIAAFTAGWLAERGFDRRYLTSVAAMACGLALVFAGGVAGLALSAGPPHGFSRAVAVGVTPFIAADLLKLLVAAGAMPALWSLVDRPNSSRN
jgi:biotin transport system substrate-specific component